ncbi:ABC transporter ATP-binding protein/permease [Aestuariibacter sp. AA17]|uniref:ABC transporter ATP-binding protein/permease n=1 Tax=Fluctibacter corallii TaxID=2984329 RepID=A0ABT3AAI7_9ALTE|nr:ABC transporter ATP-binding protein [Aestuariibacter sp. AA17]MCV2885686.1 ABC transporter ATP-binding protein/permease [Aestuariibacter sp. AA17]
MKNRHMQRIAILAPFTGLAIWALTLMVLTALIQLLFPQIVNYYVEGNQPDTLLSPLNIGLFFGAITFAILSALRFYLFEQLGIKAITRFRQQIHNRILDKNTHFFEQANISEMSSRLTVDTQELRQTITISASLFLRATLITVGSAVMMFMTSPLLSSILLVLVPAFFFATRWLGSKLDTYSQRVQNNLAKTSQVAFDNFNCHILTKIYNFKAQANHRYEDAQQKYYTSATDENRLFAGFQATFTGLVYASMITMLIVGSFLVSKNTLTVGELTAFVLYLGMAYTSLNGMSGFWAEWMQSVGATQYLFDILNEDSNNDVISSKEAIVAGDIQLSSLSFTYPQQASKPVIKELNARFEYGKCTALVGPSGAGKSTLIKLLMGLYEPTNGHICIGEQRIERKHIPALRGAIAYVEQDPVLFNASILENLQFAAGSTPPPPLEEVIDACKRANAHDFISKLPNGYHTLIGDRGGQLSGGQKQRIAIARAFLKKANIVILDEFTSALDEENQTLLNDAIAALKKDKMVIYITHKPTQIELADNIVYVEPQPC